MNDGWYYVSTPRITGGVRILRGRVVEAPPVWRKWIGVTWQNFSPRHHADVISGPEESTMQKTATRILVFSDLQSHAWQEAERPTRWLDCIKVIQAVRAIAARVKPHAVVFDGDLFEAKRNIRADVLSRTYVELRKPWLYRSNSGEERRIPFYLNAGNHDYYNGICTLSPLAGQHTHVFTVDTPVEHCAVDIHGTRVLFVPHPQSVEDMFPKHDADYEVAFTHCAIKGARMTATTVESAGDLPRWFTAQRGDRKLIVNGHYHRPQRVRADGSVDILIAGAPMAHNWSDAGDSSPRGCVLLTVADTVEVKRFPVGEMFPRFYREDAAEIRDGDFVLRRISAGSAAQTVQHHKANVIASGNTGQSLATYVKQKKPEATREEFTALVRMGLNLLGTQP